MAAFSTPARSLCKRGGAIVADSGGFMFGGLLFVVCVVLRFHYHDPIPWYIWAAALIGLLSSFSEPAFKLKRG